MRLQSAQAERPTATWHPFKRERAGQTPKLKPPFPWNLTPFRAFTALFREASSLGRFATGLRGLAGATTLEKWRRKRAKKLTCAFGTCFGLAASHCHRALEETLPRCANRHGQLQGLRLGSLKAARSLQFISKSAPSREAGRLAGVGRLGSRSLLFGLGKFRLKSSLGCEQSMRPLQLISGLSRTPTDSKPSGSKQKESTGICGLG